MVTKDLIDYIKTQTQAGKSNDEITSALLNSGWLARDIQQAFSDIADGLPAPASDALPKARRLLNDSWAVYKNIFQTLISIGLIPVAAYALCFAVGGLIYTAAQNFMPQGSLNTIPWRVAGIAGIIVAAIIIIYLSLWSAVAQLFAIKDQAEGIGWKEALKRSKSKIGMFFGTSLLAGLAMVGGLILFIIPGIIFALWFSQSPYIVVEENLKNKAALKRSKYYLKSRIGQVFRKFFYIGIITLALYTVLGIILGIIDGVLGLNPQYTSWVSSIFSLVWSPIITIYCYQLYKHLKASRP